MAEKISLLLFNPKSRLGSSDTLDDAVNYLKEKGCEITTADITKKAAVEAALSRLRSRGDTIILAGGDGTLSAIASTLVTKQLTLAVLPFGTANDFARALSIPEDIAAACDIILRDHRKTVDMGLVNGHYFFNAANIGLGTSITHEMDSQEKKLWGVFSYLKATLRSIRRQKPFYVNAKIDGRSYSFSSIHLTVANGPFYGGGNKVDSSAHINDGHLYFYSLKPLKLWRLLSLAPILRIGAQKYDGKVFNTRGKEIGIHTAHTMEIHCDGEYLTQTPAIFKIVPDALNVIAP